LKPARQIEAMQQKNMLADERERMRGELHDGTIQKVYTAALLVLRRESCGTGYPSGWPLATAVGGWTTPLRFAPET